MLLELLHSPHCRACEQFVARWPALGIRRLDVCENLERAAALGVERVPALIVDGVLVAQGGEIEAVLKHIQNTGQAA